MQVCSGCGTRWNVRDRQRTWCPRCQAALLAPSPEPSNGSRWPTPPLPPGGAGPQAWPGYRWIAVRPGVGPGRRRNRRVLSPTPRYRANPGWGLYDYSGAVPTAQQAAPAGPSARTMGSVLRLTAIVLAVAAAVHAVRYVLLLINRTTLLHPVIAGLGLWLGVLASAAALAAVIGCAIVLTRWLIARRAAVYAHDRRDDPRPPAALWAGCLVPAVNLLWAPVFVIETATIEGVYSRLRKPVIVWWVLWMLSTLLAVFAVATSFATDAQGIADNTVTTTLSYLLALAVVLALTRVYQGFVSKPVGRPAHRWVVVATEPDSVEPSEAPAAGVAVEFRDREPAV